MTQFEISLGSRRRAVAVHFPDVLISHGNRGPQDAVFGLLNAAGLH
jgi:hypothetical protein